jgi:phenylacetate-coenzyme A ligase PaaK-like adenylate-forming protein
MDRLDRDGPAFLLGEYHVLTTGGSTGEPGVFCRSQEEILAWISSTFRWPAAAGIPPPQRTAWVAARSLRHPTSTWGRLFGGAAGTDLIVPADQPFPELVDRLNALQPDSLYVVCSLLPALVDAAREGRLKLDVHRIMVGGDRLDPAAVDAAEAVFGTRPLECYPTTDVGAIGQQAPGEAGLYLNEDMLIIEPVDGQERPIAPGEVSNHLLVTALHQRTLPLIRYRIDDRVQLDPTPGRYAAYRRLAAVHGRADEVFQYGDTAVHTYTFRSILSPHPAIRDFEVRQTIRGADVAVTTSAPIDSRALIGELTEPFRRAGVPDPRVTLSVADALPRTDAGKRRLFVPLRGSARDLGEPA